MGTETLPPTSNQNGLCQTVWAGQLLADRMLKLILTVGWASWPSNCFTMEVFAILTSFIILSNIKFVFAWNRSKIVGGYDVSPGLYPWVLGLCQKGRRMPVFCGASLVTNRFVLTAAHCVYERDITR